MSAAPESEQNQKQSGIFRPGLLAALIITVSLAGIADHDLWTPDEPREAAIALEMSRGGGLIVPRLAGQPFVEKPPLFYIIASFFLATLGNFTGQTAALRLTSACCGLGTLFFTYLIGRIYFDRQRALIAAAILGTMIGFVQVTHWLLVDNALAFFITAALWALARAYEHKRYGFLPLAGLFAAGAFLVKGFIGPLIIFIAGLGLFVPWLNKPKGQAAIGRLIFIHAASLATALLICAAWIIPFAMRGGSELFREWWWLNHFGRFTGEAKHLGHLSLWPYYFAVLPVYVLPWLGLFIAALIMLAKKIRTGARPAGGGLFVWWALGTFLILSLSATKREIYLVALLPACALLCVHGLHIFNLETPAARIWKKFCWLWLSLLLVILAALTAAPLAENVFFKNALPPGWRQFLAPAIVIASLLAMSRTKTPLLQRFLTAVPLCYAAILIMICPLVDRHKSYGPVFRATADAIRARPELAIAGWKLDETTAAGFFYYAGLVFPAVSDEAMLADILGGRNSRFNGVLALKKNTSPKHLPEKENTVIFESPMGKRRLLRVLAAPNWQIKNRRRQAPRKQDG
ncbi:MAG: glycosyltransferase family 39 protein [Kiritimatiellae bacterium]|nr:glycosyltransferase family 39 protein [Kiritimatiellia bacterium]